MHEDIKERKKTILTYVDHVIGGVKFPTTWKQNDKMKRYCK